jgi:uncharacterized MAPEG superfamily protein
MTIPVYALLAFATWTYLLLFSTVGWYRWSRILTGKAPISSFKAANPEGSDWYLRAMRAHANCVENLPVFAAVVFAIFAANISTDAINTLAVIVPIARIGQTLIHVTFTETNTSVSVRFAFFLVQVICVLAMVVLLMLELT